MKITKVEAFALQAPPTDPKAYWGSRAWGKTVATRFSEVSREYRSPYRRTFIYSKTIDTVLVKITTDDAVHVAMARPKRRWLRRSPGKSWNSC